MKAGDLVKMNLCVRVALYDYWGVGVIIQHDPDYYRLDGKELIYWSKLALASWEDPKEVELIS